MSRGFHPPFQGHVQPSTMLSYPLTWVAALAILLIMPTSAPFIPPLPALSRSQSQLSSSSSSRARSQDVSVFGYTKGRTTAMRPLYSDGSTTTTIEPTRKRKRIHRYFGTQMSRSLYRIAEITSRRVKGIVTSTGITLGMRRSWTYPTSLSVGSIHLSTVTV